VQVAGHCRSVCALALTDGHPITPQDVVPSPLGMGTIAGEHITATLHFDHRVIATLLQHRFPTPVDPAIEFCGTEGRLRLAQLVWKNEGGALWLPHPHPVPGANWQALDPICPEHYDPKGPASLDDYCYVDEYVHALDEDRDHECSGSEALHVVEIMMGIFESAAYNRRVDLPQADREHPLRRWRREQGLPPLPPCRAPMPSGWPPKTDAWGERDKNSNALDGPAVFGEADQGAHEEGPPVEPLGYPQPGDLLTPACRHPPQHQQGSQLAH